MYAYINFFPLSPCLWGHCMRPFGIVFNFVKIDKWTRSKDGVLVRQQEHYYGKSAFVSQHFAFQRYSGLPMSKEEKDGDTPR